MSNNVLNHDFGYGKNPEQKIINKIELKNIKELKEYVETLKDIIFLDKIEFSIKKI